MLSIWCWNCISLTFITEYFHFLYLFCLLKASNDFSDVPFFYHVQNIFSKCRYQNIFLKRLSHLHLFCFITKAATSSLFCVLCSSICNLAGSLVKVCFSGCIESHTDIKCLYVSIFYWNVFLNLTYFCLHFGKKWFYAFPHYPLQIHKSLAAL